MTTLEGKVAVVTGAAQGLGPAYTEALGAAGVAVAAVDGHDDATQAAAMTIVADVSDIADVRRIAAAVTAELGGVDILVNNAARWRPTPVDAARDDALADFEALIATNTRGSFLMQRALVELLIERGGGDIVNITTHDVLPPRPAPNDGTNSPSTDVYNASKWALNGFTQEWALTLRPHRIRVNAIAADATHAAAQQAQLLVALLREGSDGRTGETIGSWVGEPIALPPRRGRGEDIV